ncbi:MAG: hypothetical protein H7325_02080, partial [Pedobacter sp.]|nr:hypothetical protein [Pedobacter sp.]
MKTKGKEISNEEEPIVEEPIVGYAFVLNPYVVYFWCCEFLVHVRPEQIAKEFVLAVFELPDTDV